MWYVVNFWDHDDNVGEFLNHRKFDSLLDAVTFASIHETTAQDTLGLVRYKLENFTVKYLGDDLLWHVAIALDDLINLENENG